MPKLTPRSGKKPSTPDTPSANNPPAIAGARRAAYEALARIDGGAYPNLAINAELGALGDDDRRFATKLVYTVSENREALDSLLAKFLQKPVKPALRRVLRMGACQMAYMDVPARAAVDESVKLTKELGKKELAPFVNAVLRNAARDIEAARANDSAAARTASGKLARGSLTRNAPSWLCEMWARDYGEAFADELIASFGERPVVVRRNALKIGENELLREAERFGLEFTRGALVNDALKLAKGVKPTGELFQNGRIAIQSEASQWACRVVDAKPKMKILDACAAPGGKTALLAANIGNEGQIIAWDKHPHRVELIKRTCERLGAKCVSASVQNATQFLPEYEMAFDAVLVDAPCSGLGVCKSGLWESKRPEDIAALAVIQRELLDVCSRYVKPGGALVYSTCTISRAENEAVAKAFTSAHPVFIPDDISRFLPDRSDCGPQFQLFPAMYNTDGFFAARWIRSHVV